MIAPLHTGGFVSWAETRDACFFEAPILSFTRSGRPYVPLKDEPFTPQPAQPFPEGNHDEKAVPPPGRLPHLFGGAGR